MIVARSLVVTISLLMAAELVCGAADAVSDGFPAASLLEVAHVAIPTDSSGRRAPNWSGGALLVVDGASSSSPSMQSFAKDGRLVSHKPFAMPDAKHIRVSAAQRSKDGTIALVGSALARDGRSATFLSVVFADGQRQQTTRLSPFYPYQVAIAPDGTYWVAGEDEKADHNIIRRFSATGDQLGGWMSRSSLPTSDSGHPAEDSFLASSRDRIAWYSNFARAYVEFSPGSELLAKVTGPALNEGSRVDGIAVCDNGSVFVSVFPLSEKDRRTEILTLDRGSGIWKPVTLRDSLPMSARRTGLFTAAMETKLWSGRALVAKAWD